MARVNANSELTQAQFFQFNEVNFWGRTQPPAIEPDGSDTLHKVQDDDRLDRLATRYYGDPHLKWVIAQANMIWLEPNDLAPNAQLRIPTRTRLRSLGIKTR